MKPRSSFFFPRHGSLPPHVRRGPPRLPAVHAFRECSNGLFLIGLCVVAGVPSECARAEEWDRWNAESPSFVLTPSRLPQRLDESPSSVTVIDRALIAASGARRLEEVLRLIPGFQVGYKYNNQPLGGRCDESRRQSPLFTDGQDSPGYLQVPICTRCSRSQRRRVRAIESWLASQGSFDGRWGIVERSFNER